MTTKTYMLGVCLALASVGIFASEQTFAQTARTATKPPQTQTLPSTGSAATTQSRSDEFAEPDATKSHSEVAAQKAAERQARSNGNADIKAWRVEFTNWLATTPGAKEQLDATEADLYRRNEWTQLYNYRHSQSTKTN